ncbi:hypothetical protein FXW78_23950 [Rhodococcus opacus]|nr:hypothetical protein [Rhodococcus opacus]TQC43058.1 hypothetical protein EEB14_45200 [Rhodococcus sp. WS4]
MSVVVIARFPVADTAAATQSLTDNAELLDEITDDAKTLGAEHHRFVAGADELVVIDQWTSAESFHMFFDGNGKVAIITEQAGVQASPTIEIFETVDAAGTF